MAEAGILLDRAKAAKEVATFAAIALLAQDDEFLERRIDQALLVCDVGSEYVTPEGDELDCASIAKQAITDALTFYETNGAPKHG